MLLGLALLAVLGIGVIVGLLWGGTVLLGDRQTVDRLAAQLLAELRMHARTQATMQAMRQVAREAMRQPPSDRS